MIDTLFNQLKNDGYNFFTGVPDSALKPFQNSRKINMMEDSIPVYKVEKVQEPEYLPFTPIQKTDKMYHNCMEIYNIIKNCPLCRKIYKRYDGIYIFTIIILCIIIIILLKIIFQK